MPDPRLWGEPFWATLHYVALGYPERDPSPEQQDAYAAFYAAAGHVLPCSACAANFLRHTDQLPLGPALAQGRDALFAWTVALHNTVNRELGKPELTAEAARAKLEAGPPPPRRPPAPEGGRTASLVLIGSNVALVVALVLLGIWCIARKR